MKNFNFKAIIIAIIAPIVKLFPAWALKFTKKSNPFAEKFMISSKREIKYLAKHLKSVNWISERRWRLQTYKLVYACKDPHSLAFQAFINNIDNSEVFDAAYAEVPVEAVEAKGYTLDSKRVITACNDNIDYFYILEKKQPRSFTPDIVRQLEEKVRSAYYDTLYTYGNWQELAKLDSLLYHDWENASTMEMREKAKRCLDSLLENKDYLPNLTAGQLRSLGDKFETWSKEANPNIVADKMLQYWKKGKNFNEIFALLERFLSAPKADTSRAIEISSMLEGTEFYTPAVIAMIGKGIARPQDFSCLTGDAESIKKNLEHCIAQKVESLISNDDFALLDNTQKASLLEILAKRGKLSLDLLSTVQDNQLKKKLINILEENAQAKWFASLLGHSIVESYIRDLDSMPCIYGKTQSLSFHDGEWVQIFVEKNWYDEEHIVKLMQSPYAKSIRIFIEKYGLTQKQFEALLTGQNSALAPKVKKFLN